MDNSTFSPSCAAFCELKSLEILNLHHNLLEGVLPACLSNMSSLRVLGLARNQFTGEIPSFFSNLYSVETIDVGSNLFDGVVSFSMFSNLSNLGTLILSDNKHLEVETEPFTWDPLFQLGSLHLGNCNLNKNSGNMIPSFISNQSILVDLDLSHNSLVGSIPTWMFSNVGQLLRLKNNRLNGQFLERPVNFTSYLQVLDISDNNIHGSLPDNFGELFPLLSQINMSKNSLEGNIPPSFGELSSLELLDLSNNHLTGKIPQTLAIKGDLFKYLMLSNNSLRGEMLPRDCNLTELRLLQLDSNNFTGAIPPCLSNSHHLEYLDIGNNHLSGNLSSWLPVLPEMRVLLLGRNPFKGDIPKQLCQMQKLQILDLSYGSFSGNIPSCLNEITSWKNPSLSSNGSILGVVPSPFKNSGIRVRVVFTTKSISYRFEGVPLTLMIGADLSSNSLTGNIPFEMGDLRELHSLNLSNNLLEGPIPASFQKLKNLETLDLSHNKLNGTIPREFVQITTLSVFSVAFNNLSGRIPDGGQFWTFEERRYAGNPYLCGKPLERICPSDNRTQYHNEEEEASRLIDKPIFFYIVVGVSYILGFWGAIVLLILNKRWRVAYFKVTDRYFNFCFEKLSMFWCR